MRHSGVVAALAAVASDARWSSLSSEVRRRTLASVADWFAVALAGAKEPVVSALASTVATAVESDPRSAQLVRFGRRVSVGDAAFINGTAGHVLDYDDTSVGLLEGHPTAVILPGLLALAEGRGLGLDDVLEPYIAGVNVASCLGARVNPAHYAAGWHATATVGSVGAAAAAARLLALRGGDLADAISLAVTQAGGLRVSFGTMAKSLQVGRASTTAVFCALAAAAGSDSPADPISGNPSFAWLDVGDNSAMADASSSDASELTIVKWHASCHSTHAALEAIECLSVSNTDIDWLEIGVREDLLDVCGIDQPSTGLELKFSLRGVAAMLLAGFDTSDPGQFDQLTLDSGQWRQTMAKVRVAPADLPSAWQTTVTLGTRDGEKFTSTVDLRDPVSTTVLETRVRRKFERLATPVLGSDRASQLHDLITGSGQVAVRDIMAAAGQVGA